MAIIPNCLPKTLLLGKWRRPQKLVLRRLSINDKATVPSCSHSTVEMGTAVVPRILVSSQGEAPGVLYLGGQSMSLLCLEPLLLHQVSNTKMRNATVCRANRT